MTGSSSPYYMISIPFVIGLLLLDLVVLAGYYSRPEQIESLLEPELGDTLQIDESELRLDEGVILTGVRLSERAGNKSPILSLKRMSIRFNPVDLLMGKTTPSEIVIDQPKCTVQQMSDGRLNIQHFIDALPEPEKETGQPTKFELETNVSLTNGSVTLKNLPSLLSEGHELKLHNLDVDLRPIRNGTGVIFDGDAIGSLDRVSFNGRYHENSLSVQTTAHSLNVRKELIDMFSPEVRDIWQTYRATGPAKITYRLEHEFSQEEPRIPPDAHSLTVHPHDMNASFEEFPYPMKNLRGMMQFTADGLTFELRSDIDNASFSVNGHTDGYGDRSELNVGIQAEHVPINADIYTALEPLPDVRSFVDSLSPEGKVNATGTITRQEGREDVDFLIRIYPQDIKVTYAEFPYPFEQVHGSVIIEPDQVRLENIEAVPGRSISTTDDTGARLNGTIRFPQEQNDSTSYQLQVNATDIPLEETLKQNLPEPVRDTWEELRPEGTGAVQWSIRKSPGLDSPRHTVEASLQNCTLNPVRLNQPIENVSASIHFENEQVTVSNATGNWNNGTITVNQGQIGTSENKPYALFQVNAKNISVNSSLKELVFNNKTFREGIKNTGTVDLNGSIRWFQQHETPEIEYYISLNVDGVGFKKIVDITDIEGKIILKGENDQGNGSEPSFTGGADLTTMTVNGIRLSAFRSNFILRKEKLQFRELSGKLLNGNLQGGLISLDLANESFSVAVDTSGLSLQELFTSLDIEERNLSGTMFGNAELSGTFADLNTWTGKGAFELRNAQLWRLPLFLPILTKLSLSKQEPFNQGHIKFDVMNSKVCVRDLRFESSSSRMTGEGWVGFDGRQLIGLKIKEIDPIISVPVIGWVYSQLTGNLFTFKATGTIMEPSVSVQPLPTIFNNNVDCPKK
jgi:hypothetical protein